MRDLIGWNDADDEIIGKMWEPRALTAAEWPPDYDAVYRWRRHMLRKLKRDPKLLAAARNYYSNNYAKFIMHWMDTYDPRKEGSKWVPFVFFEKQEELIDFFNDLNAEQEGGLIEKSRDMGATWVACAYSSCTWIFEDSFAVGWGSRKQDLVDKLGDPDSIFEKIRLLLDRLPDIWMPKKFKPSKHSSRMKLFNPENGSIIAGESGDGIGRGGRKSMYFKDESAHYERPEKIEAALGDNTNVQIDMSSVNGLGNVFHNRREHGVIWERNKIIEPGFVRIFIMDWKDHPAKTQEWYDTRRAKYEREGMLHIFKQEVDRDYSGAISNVVIPYEWVKSCIDAHIDIPYFAEAYEREKKHARWLAGLDIADSGKDRNALSMREWVIWRSCDEWGARDPGVSARKAITACRPYAGNIECMYDSVGMGVSVKSEYNRLTQDEKLIDANQLPFIPWNAGAGVLNPYNRIIEDDEESLLNRNFFDSLKPQGWWSLRTRCYKTHMARTEGIVYDPNEMISIDSRMPLIDQLCKELAQPTSGQSTRLKMIIEKRPDGTKSPNLADSGMQMYFPVPYNETEARVGNYGS